MASAADSTITQDEWHYNLAKLFVLIYEVIEDDRRSRLSAKAKKRYNRYDAYLRRQANKEN